MKRLVSHACREDTAVVQVGRQQLAGGTHQRRHGRRLQGGVYRRPACGHGGRGNVNACEALGTSLGWKREEKMVTLGTAGVPRHWTQSGTTTPARPPATCLQGPPPASPAHLSSAEAPQRAATSSSATESRMLWGRAGSSQVAAEAGGGSQMAAQRQRWPVKDVTNVAAGPHFVGVSCL